MENTLEETLENPGNGETPETETPVEEQPSKEADSPSSPPDSPVRQDIYERMKRAEKEAKDLKEQLERKSKTPYGQSAPSSMDFLKLTKALEGRSQDEVDFITRYAKTSNIDDIIAASKDPWVEDAIETRRKKVADQKKIPGSTPPGFVESQSPDLLAKKLADAKSPEERLKIHREFFEKSKKEEKSQGII